MSTFEKWAESCQRINKLFESYDAVNQSIKSYKCYEKKISSFNDRAKKNFKIYITLHESLNGTWEDIFTSINSGSRNSAREALRKLNKLFPDIKTLDDLEKKLNLILIRLMCLSFHLSNLIDRKDNLFLFQYSQLKNIFLSLFKNRLSLILIIKFNTEFYKFGGLAHD